jgi:hypothetical protein
LRSCASLGDELGVPLAPVLLGEWHDPSIRSGVYQHANREREREITAAPSRRIEAARTGDLARTWHEVDPDSTADGV